MEGRNRIIFETEYVGVFFACKSVHELPLAAVFMRFLKAKSPGSSPGNATKKRFSGGCFGGCRPSALLPLLFGLISEAVRIRE
jgi:hypothetical protein